MNTGFTKHAIHSASGKALCTYLKKGLPCNPSLLIKALSICSKRSFIILTCNTLKKKIRILAIFILMWSAYDLSYILGGRGLAWEGVATGIKLSGLFNHRFQCLNPEDSDDGDSPHSTNPSSTPLSQPSPL